ncbi:hypothetical protein [Actinophytocola sp.]|uniref:hypothetical protein n=1 Tax=Actinophytocola sp. TaxID=1872138 RepID=UPI002D805DBA|nr:hypothetical protein [Actinophytocola sp.]HET9139336.1 hypothetical protein [Actinophytocola sp.]
MVRSNYELRVSGRLSERATCAVGEFAGLTVRPGPAETTIHAVVIDEAQLHGLLALLESHGLRICSMRRVDGAGEAGSGPASPASPVASEEPGSCGGAGSGVDAHVRGGHMIESDDRAEPRTPAKG